MPTISANVTKKELDVIREYANALSVDNKEKVKTVSLDLISKSYLNDLKVLIQNSVTKLVNSSK